MDMNVDIYVKPNPDPTGKEPYIFSMDDGKGSTNELVFDKTKDGMPKKDNYTIKFKLKNQDGAALRFSKVIGKVLWAKPVALVTDTCPDSDCYMNGIFYVDPTSAIKDHELTVINTDPDVQLFKFALNFLPPGESDPPPSGYVWYDPIGNNQNGGLPRSFLELNAVTVGGTAIGAVVGGLVAPLFNPAATTMTYLVGAVIGAVVGYVAGQLIGKPGGGSVRSAPHA